ncbi:prepilin-type N-terminal cleavage/methylation domain-containing protein [Alisedimentitalea sp. MJ-SS2]|uniref:prepilin-type N-terminal cleavage/methylation domain-containing protein n=1 Tax=Aliisedimentitalea sp. MJ-SS2 TaxID=3049795 RepID=UPI0029096A9F|nr:prepilin-type N-terminal cleavage/methylation domain-containing protein [Alisedimentitalea sp. MJ-SS2]MDU8925812.1 prepilin-type N-terminal cleavage/methylation domain-containing protein [Alisedimentitalea sp. MJ-SS2]
MGDAVDQPGNHARAGFSLIELLVVIAILAVLALGVVFTVGRDSKSSDLEAFRSAFVLQRDLAIEGREMRGLRIGPRVMQVMVWRPGDGQEPAGWQGAGDGLRWRGRVGFSTAQIPPMGAPEIVFLPDGQGSGFSVQFDDGARCESDGWTGLSCG